MTQVTKAGGSAIKPRNPAYVRDTAGHARALRKDMRGLPMAGDPDSPIHPRGRWFDFDANRMRSGDAECAGNRDLVLYAAAIGRKRGELPDDLSDWHAMPDGCRDGGCATVLFRSGKVEIPVSVRFLDYQPVMIEGPIIEASPERCTETEALRLPPAKVKGLPAKIGDHNREALARQVEASTAEQPKSKKTRRKAKVITLIGRRGCQSFRIGF